jgi:hypothetical protein
MLRGEEWGSWLLRLRNGKVPRYDKPRRLSQFLLRGAGQMWLILMLFWSAAAVRQCGGPDILRYYSRFGTGGFPVRGAGIWRQWIDIAHTFFGKPARRVRNSIKFPFRRERPGHTSLPGKTDRGR